MVQSKRAKRITVIEMRAKVQTENELLQAALSYRNDYGFSVIPLNINKKTERKKPRVKWKSYQSERPTEEQIRDWWTRWPDADVGIVTGSISGLFVLDVDNEEGWEYVTEEKRVASEPTPMVKTGHGYHVYYRYPDRNIDNKVRIGDKKYGLDVRNDGGFVAAPPSIHYSGTKYQWLNSLSDNSLQHPPEWLFNEIEEDAGGTGTVDIESGVSEGKRNDSATKMAGKLFNKYGADSETLVWQELQEWNSNNNPPLDEEELATVFRSIKKREQSSSDSTTSMSNSSSSSEKKSYLKMADEFLKREKEEEGRCWQYVPENGYFYRYIEDKGVWDKIDLQYLRTEIRRFALSVSAKLDKNHSIKEIISAIKDLQADPENRRRLNPAHDPDLKLINVKNGMLDWKEDKLVDHDPEYYSTNQLSIKYDPTAGYDKWQATMEEWIPGEETRMFLQEFVGYSLIPDTSRQKSVILYGSGSNGKSTFLEVISKLFGEDNLTHIGLHRLSERFERGKLAGKLVNIFPDIESDYITNTGSLKTLIAGEQLRGEDKFKPSYDFRPIARLMFSANELPNASDKTDAWYRRFEFVEFPYTFKPGDEGYNSNLKNELLGELPGIFNWALEGLRRLKDNGHFTTSEAMEESKTKYKAVNDSVKYFYETSVIETDVEDFLPTKYMYRKYKSFCDDTGMNIASMQKFSKRLTELGLTKIRRRTTVCHEHGRYHCPECGPGKEEKQARGFKGVNLSM